MKQQVMVIHGGDTFNTYKEYLIFLQGLELDFDKAQTKFWKDTLGERLGDSYQVIFPRMPNALNAKYGEWKIWFKKYLPYLSDGVILVGHSLGGIFLAKYLSENIFPKRIAGTFLIAAPFDAGDTTDSLGDFVLPASLAKLEAQGGTVCFFHSKDDPVVPFQDVLKYQKAVPSAEVVTFSDRQHFTIEEFPEITERIYGLSK